MDYIELLDNLESCHTLAEQEWCFLIENRTPETDEEVFSRARKWQKAYYGNRVFTRGLIEISSYCKNDCYYCGLRKSNQHAERYRLNREEILSCVDAGYELGFRTFVMQGGEDAYFDTERIADLVVEIKKMYPDCAVTLSLGEHPRATYQAWREAGADRYLLRHETADPAYYRQLHPEEMLLETRKQCLYDLKELGYQTGTGFMVGTPGQTPAHLARDLMFITELDPAMVGIGPFVPHHETPFAKEPGGTADLTLFLVGLLRILKPNLLLPATTALGTIDAIGREKGILAGANVVMPNLSPVDVRSKYAIYDNKICTGEEAAECRGCLEQRVRSIGYELVVDRGDAAAREHN